MPRLIPTRQTNSEHAMQRAAPSLALGATERPDFGHAEAFVEHDWAKQLLAAGLQSLRDQFAADHDALEPEISGAVPQTQATGR